MTEHIATDREQVDKLLALGPGLIASEEITLAIMLDKQLLRGLSLSARKRNTLDEIVRERT